MPKITLVTYELNQGGTNRVLTALANGFVEAGYATQLITCTSAGALDLELRGKLDPAIRYTSLGEKPWKSRTLGQIAAVPAYRSWKQYQLVYRARPLVGREEEQPLLHQDDQSNRSRARQLPRRSGSTEGLWLAVPLVGRSADAERQRDSHAAEPVSKSGG
jgi:hypothetical protein